MDDPIRTLSRRRFEGALETPFEIRACEANAGSFSARLVEVKARPAPPGREQFSVLFVGPAEPVWPQGTYRFTHPALGEVDLFMVPVGRGSQGIEYEVCFSLDTRAA
jgi:hypothetical protein